MMNIEDLIGASSDPLAIGPLLINIVIGFVLSLILRKHFQVFGSTLSNREEFSQVFPFILLTTLLIITIVKSSLALSLGLVGALSIVRFRTPIKEPEELAYLFIAIAIGLGLGANQVLATITGSLSIMILMALIGRYKKKLVGKNIYLSLDIVRSSDGEDNYLDQLNQIIGAHTILNDLRRYDFRSDLIEATYFIDISSIDSLSALAQELTEKIPGISVTFLDQNQLPSL
jgi:hypothetical protein